jgi:uncharacterized small protein (DUF1192 family)
MAVLLLLGAGMLPLAGVASAQAPLFEVESDDAKLLQVGQDAGFLVRGTFNAGAIPASGGGARLMWYPGKAAFRAGIVDGDSWDDAKVGQWSMALGRNNTASGTHSLALNADTEASGDRSIAGGGGSTASGQFSLAMGQVTVASGFGSVALGVSTKATADFATATGREAVASAQAAFATGYATVASGAYSMAAGFASQATAERAFAMGDHTTAAGLSSVALGAYVSAGAGSFVFGDRSSNQVQAAGVNEFIVRAHGGIGFNSGPSIGCDLPAGSGAWACTSSRLAKEGFEDVNGETVLARLAGIRIQRWSYLGNGVPHLGPTAEDFRAAFGLGETATKIATVDADGIALLGVQTLERRTAELRAELAALRAELAAIRAEMTGRGSVPLTAAVPSRMFGAQPTPTR